jgi:hypothetical protein
MPAAFDGEPMRSASTRLPQGGIESVQGDELLLRLISPLRPGCCKPGRQRGLPLPGDCHTPQRELVAVLVTAIEARPLRSLSEGDRSRG